MAVDQDNASHEESIADADLVLRTRSGDAAAFGELWRRHYPSGMSVARSITSSIDPDDLVQESYTRIYQAILKGGGPNGSFRAYLFTSIRNTAAAWGRARRESAIDELDAVADPDSTEQAANEALDRSLTAQAFRSLPSRWQEVLWYTEIEQMKPAEAGALLGMKAGAVSQLAFRAREGLREAWIQAHLRSAEPGSDCQWTIEHLGAYSRGNLAARDLRRLETHIGECARCMIVAAEADDVSKRLALVLLPLVLGVTGAAGYLATLQGAGTPIVALAAMPSGVTEGAVVATTAGGAGFGGSGSGDGAAAGGGTATGGGAAGGGVLSGMGALVGAGSAALVVAGVVAAAAIVPGLTGADAMTSLPSAGESGSSSISADVGPDASMSTETTPVTLDDGEPDADPVDPPVEEVVPEQVVERTGPSAAPIPTIPVSPPVAQPGPGEGEENPGGEYPGGENPGGEEPALPAGSPAIEGATVTFSLDDFKTRYLFDLTGAPDAAVTTTVDGVVDTAGSGTLTASPDTPLVGRATVEIRPTFAQLCRDAVIAISYTATGRATETSLWAIFDPREEYPEFDLACILFDGGDETPADTVDAEAARTEATTTPAPVEPAAEASEVVDPAPAPAPADPAPVEAAPVEAAPVAPPAPAGAADPVPAQDAAIPAPEETAAEAVPAL